MSQRICDNLIVVRDYMNPSTVKTQSLSTLLTAEAKVDTYVFYLTLDRDFCAAVNAVWKECDERGLQSSRLGQVEPHITIGASASLASSDAERDIRFV